MRGTLTPLRRQTLTPSVIKICSAEQDDHAQLIKLRLCGDGGVKCHAEARFAFTPLGLIELLSDLKDPDSSAEDWRQRCRDWAAIPDYQQGDKISLAALVTRTDGSICQIVTATHYRRGRQKRRCYRIEETGRLVRLSKASLAGSELLSSAKGEASPVLAEYLAGRD